MTAPETRYARSGGVHIAYQVVGDGPVDIIHVPAGMQHVEHIWESPPQARFLSRLASISRLFLFDKRGTGMSDRVFGTPTLETRMDDIRAVMDDAGSERALLFGAGDAGPLCALFAATYPERTIGLVLFNSAPRFLRSPDLPFLPTQAEQERRLDEILRRWGEPAFHEDRLKKFNPSATAEERKSTGRIFRLSVSPGAAADYYRMYHLDVDVRDVLPSIHVPALVMYRGDVPVARQSARDRTPSSPAPSASRPRSGLDAADPPQQPARSRPPATRIPLPRPPAVNACAPASTRRDCLLPVAHAGRGVSISTGTVHWGNLQHDRCEVGPSSHAASFCGADDDLLATTCRRLVGRRRLRCVSELFLDAIGLRSDPRGVVGLAHVQNEVTLGSDRLDQRDIENPVARFAGAAAHGPCVALEAHYEGATVRRVAVPGVHRPQGTRLD
jgi:pimeloyl-ACP methyl ester carboxylesterase